MIDELIQLRANATSYPSSSVILEISWRKLLSLKSTMFFLSLAFSSLGLQPSICNDLSRILNLQSELRSYFGWEEFNSMSHSLSLRYDPENTLKCLMSDQPPDSPCIRENLDHYSPVMVNLFKNYDEIMRIYDLMHQIHSESKCLPTDESVFGNMGMSLNDNQYVNLRAEGMDLSFPEKSHLEKRELVTLLVCVPYIVTLVFGIKQLMMGHLLIGLLMVTWPLSVPAGLVIAFVVLATIFSPLYCLYPAIVALIKGSFNALRNSARSIPPNIRYAIESLRYYLSNDASMHMHELYSIIDKETPTKALIAVYGLDLRCYDLKNIKMKMESDAIFNFARKWNINNERVFKQLVLMMMVSLKDCIVENCITTFKDAQNDWLAGFLNNLENFDKYEQYTGWIIVTSYENYDSAIPIIDSWSALNPNAKKHDFALKLKRMWTEKCTICMEDKDQNTSVVGRCGHSFHATCINDQDRTCPICKLKDVLNFKKGLALFKEISVQNALGCPEDKEKKVAIKYEGDLDKSAQNV
eukprot:NODE_561_length_6677_cov_0.349650.p1 type:complete len:525 gc:universal NODE_561_length_6677_cov_0.349650:2360-786(-)